jgi:hypothetical protein
MDTFERLRSMTTPELVERIDSQLRASDGGQERHTRNLIASQLYINEFARRDQEKTTDTMLHLTQEMHSFTREVRNLTLIILGATIVSLVVGIFTLWMAYERHP